MLTARPAVLSDATWLLALRNDPETVAASRQGRAVTQEEHARWLRLILAATANTPASRALMIVEVPLSLAARLDPRAAMYRLDGLPTLTAEVSVAVAPRYRGAGLAADVIRLAAEHAVRLGMDSVYAVVLAGNVRSEAAFARAGFTRRPIAPAAGGPVRYTTYAAEAYDVAGWTCAACTRGVPQDANTGDVRAPRYEHAIDDSRGAGLRKCDAGDLWIAWERGRRERLDVLRARGAAAGSTPAASTKIRRRLR